MEYEKGSIFFNKFTLIVLVMFFELNSLRHTVNTDLRRAGVQESVISAILGHVNNTMFGRYNTIDVDDLRQAMSKLEFYRNGIRQNVRQADQVT